MSIGKTSRYGTVQMIRMDEIKPSPFQVRKRLGKIPQLAEDIKEHGLLQPILVRPANGKFEVVHGHRRFKAVQRLNRDYIGAFIKELTDIEAIRIQGSENLQRKDYDPIEEATLYDNYRTFWEQEKKEALSYKGIAEAFNTSGANVENKLGLLDLPESVQKKIIEGLIPVRKVEALIPLTREPLQRAVKGKFEAGMRFKERTDKYFIEIKQLAEEIERGDEGGLRTRDGVREATHLILEGAPLEKALEDAKLKESLEIAKKQAEQGKRPTEIISNILQAQQDPDEVAKAMFDLQVEHLRKLLETGNLKCPHCERSDCLMWGCCEETVLENVEKNS